MGFLLFPRFSSFVMRDQCRRSCCTLSDGKINNSSMEGDRFNVGGAAINRHIFPYPRKQKTCFQYGSDQRIGSADGALKKQSQVFEPHLKRCFFFFSCFPSFFLLIQSGVRASPQALLLFFFSRLPVFTIVFSLDFR